MSRIRRLFRTRGARLFRALRLRRFTALVESSRGAGVRQRATGAPNSQFRKTLSSPMRPSAAMNRGGSNPPRSARRRRTRGIERRECGRVKRRWPAGRTTHSVASSADGSRANPSAELLSRMRINTSSCGVTPQRSEELELVRPAGHARGLSAGALWGVNVRVDDGARWAGQAAGSFFARTGDGPSGRALAIRN